MLPPLPASVGPSPPPSPPSPPSPRPDGACVGSGSGRGTGATGVMFGAVGIGDAIGAVGLGAVGFSWVGLGIVAGDELTRGPVFEVGSDEVPLVGSVGGDRGNSFDVVPSSWLHATTTNGTTTNGTTTNGTATVRTALVETHRIIGKSFVCAPACASSHQDTNATGSSGKAESVRNAVVFSRKLHPTWTFGGGLAPRAPDATASGACPRPTVTRLVSSSGLAFGTDCCDRALTAGCELRCLGLC